MTSDRSDSLLTSHNLQQLSSERLIKYCSINDFQGEEGKYLDTAHFEMIALVMTIRHGDRSAIHSIPGKYTPPDQSSKDGNENDPFLFDPEVKQYTSSASKFTILPISGSGDFDRGGETGDTGVSFMDALDAPRLFGTSDTKLAQGQLTSTGFMQHVHLGDHLHTSYGAFSKSITNPKEVYIRSTNYHRTIQVSILILVLMLFYPIVILSHPIVLLLI